MAVYITKLRQVKIDEAYKVAFAHLTATDNAFDSSADITLQARK